jgi:hypothetical protein
VLLLEIKAAVQVYFSLFLCPTSCRYHDIIHSIHLARKPNLGLKSCDGNQELLNFLRSDLIEVATRLQKGGLGYVEETSEFEARVGIQEHTFWNLTYGYPSSIWNSSWVINTALNCLTHPKKSDVWVCLEKLFIYIHFFCHLLLDLEKSWLRTFVENQLYLFNQWSYYFKLTSFKCVFPCDLCFTVGNSCVSCFCPFVTPSQLSRAVDCIPVLHLLLNTAFSGAQDTVQEGGHVSHVRQV